MKNERTNVWQGRSRQLLLSGLACLSLAGGLTYLGPSVYADPPAPLPPLDPLDATDHANHLVNGTTTIVELSSGQTTDLSFMADGPGMLTLTYTDTNNNRSFEVLGPDGRQLSWSNRLRLEHTSIGNTQVAYVTVPLAVAGEHTVRLRAGGTGELGVGAAWMPFEQVSIGLVNDPRNGPFIDEVQVPAPVIAPDPDLATAITPGEAQAGQVPAGPSDRTFSWMRFTAENDGELALMFTSANGDLTLELYEEGSYDRALQDIDNDLNRSVGCEGMVINARAGRSYMVSVNNLRGTAVQYNLRSVWLGDDTFEEPAGGGGGGDEAHDAADDRPDAAQQGRGGGQPDIQFAEEAGLAELEFGIQQGEVLLNANQIIVQDGNFIDDKELQQLLLQLEAVE